MEIRVTINNDEEKGTLNVIKKIDLSTFLSDNCTFLIEHY